MEQIRAVAAAVGATLIMMTAGWSAAAAEAEPSATITVKQVNSSIGMGFQSGEGTLALKDGSEYAITMDAYSLLGLGYARGISTGKVFNLEKAADLSGEYSGTEMYAAFGKGKGKSTLKNDSNKVRIVMESKLSGLSADIGVGSVIFRLGQRLKGPDAPPPVAAAPAPPPIKAAPIPVAIQNPTNYTLHFGFNKARVNSANGGVLDSVLADWKEKGATFRIVGHADMVGSDKYNMRLSRKRAEAVKQLLIEKGVPATHVIAVGVGQKELAVPTKRGQRLRENRRVTLTVLTEK